MRRATEHSGNIRALVLGGISWDDKIHHSTIQGGGNQMVPSALAALAAAESQWMFYLLKLSQPGAR